MTQGNVRIVVAEGPSNRKGLLRFVLEGEGYEVVGEASDAGELAREITTHEPDVVVMDDGIGATAVGMTHELAPAAKVVLVWPDAVVPIGGDARVSPSAVLRTLGPTVERLTGVPSATGSMDDAAKGALGLGAILALGRAAGSNHPTLGDLPPTPEPNPDEPIIEDLESAAVLILPVAPVIDPVADAGVEGPLTMAELEDAESSKDVAVAVGTAGAVGVAMASGSAAAAPAAAIAWNRRLGTIALGGVAVAGSLVLALALGNARIPVQGVSGQGPSIASPTPGEVPTTPPPRIPAVIVPGVLLGDQGRGTTSISTVRPSPAPIVVVSQPGGTPTTSGGGGVPPTNGGGGLPSGGGGGGVGLGSGGSGGGGGGLGNDGGNGGGGGGGGVPSGGGGVPGDGGGGGVPGGDGGSSGGDQHHGDGEHHGDDQHHGDGEHHGDDQHDGDAQHHGDGEHGEGDGEHHGDGDGQHHGDGEHHSHGD